MPFCRCLFCLAKEHVEFAFSIWYVAYNKLGECSREIGAAVRAEREGHVIVGQMNGQIVRSLAACVALRMSILTDFNHVSLSPGYGLHRRASTPCSETQGVPRK